MNTVRRLKLLRLLLSLLIISVFVSCTEEETEVFGNVHGFVSDSGTGEPVRNASVSISPGGEITVTGDKGRFEYNKLEPGRYTIQISKEKYQTDVTNVTVTPGETAQVDISLKPGDSHLRVSTNELNFGSSYSIMSFDVINAGKTDLTWIIKKEAAWITKIEPDAGTTAKTTAVSITIDRTQLEKGKTYEDHLIVSSNSGSEKILVTVQTENTINPGPDPITAGLVAYYTFDNEDAKDRTDNGHNGNLHNNPSFIDDTPGGYGKAIHLIGTKVQYVSIPYNFFNGLRNYAISMWVKDYAGFGVFFSSINSGDSYTDFPTIYSTDANKFQFYTTMNIYANDNPPFIVDHTDMQQEWHLLTCVVTGTTARIDKRELYIDGNLVDVISKDNYRESYYEGTKTFIGGNNNNKYKETITSMKVDNVRIYNRSLSAKDVKAIYDYEKKK